MLITEAEASLAVGVATYRNHISAATSPERPPCDKTYAMAQAP